MVSLLIISTLLTTAADTTADIELNIDEVVVASTASQGGRRAVKGQAASIDEHIGNLRNVAMVRRGSYAWEPVVNNMPTERLSTTIDGMKIFYACTDKMDPVTSYVESGNLQTISLNSGLDGNPQATGNIGGSLDLRLRKAGFDADPLRVNLSAGHEWNGHVQVYGADAALSGHRAYANIGAFYRQAENYKIGGGERLQFSQFHKVNVFSNLGFRLTDNDAVEATFIFDRATDVGYPALNMDVGLAEGIITSLSFKHLFEWASWETKVYYNHITHEMDDTQRPDVEIHMDMPGRSQTAGLYSLLTASRKRHDLALNYDLYHNRRFADMTMYPGGAAPMYMVTWPDVATLNTGLALTDNIGLTENQQVRLSAKVAWQHQRLDNEEGYHALKVFFPAMTDAYYQTTGRVAASYRVQLGGLQLSAGAGWGSRAPTVTEAYGYYLNNTFDQYDYIGNPHLKNESAFELNAALKWRVGANLQVSIDGNAFRFADYIIGHLEERISPMTVGAEGVKVYGNISRATIANASATAEWQPLQWLNLNGKLGIGSGRDADSDPLPLIAPVSWQTQIGLNHGRWQAQVVLRGNGRQSHFAAKYGETETPAWTVCDLSALWQKPVGDKRLTVRAGIENLLDRRYATYADWNEIPQKGRNVFVNLTFEW